MSLRGSAGRRLAGLSRALVGSLPALVPFVALVVAGCPAAPAPRQRLDLASLLPEAELWQETIDLDLGTAQPEAALLGGWSAPSRGAADYLWGTGERSVLAFRRADARAFRIQMRGWAPPGLTRGQKVAVALDGTGLGEVELGPEPRTVAVEVPEGTARPGWNRLELSYPVDVPTGRFGRPLGAAWDGFRFGASGRAASAVVIEAAGGGFDLPAGGGIDLFVDVPGGARLVLAGVDAAGEARLEADLECAGETVRFGLLAGGERDVALRASGLPTAACRLTLRAEASPAAGSGAGIHIAAAALETPLAPAAPRSPTSPAPAAREVRPAAPRNIVVYIVDALRADRLGCYGHGRALTPAIDRFAGSAVVCENARAQASWTRPAVATLFTGLTPLRHGATGVESRLPEEVVTLAELFAGRGYRTGYVTANGNTSEVFGFGQGMTFFRALHGVSEEDKVSWQEVHRAAREFLDGASGSQPFFLVLHTVEPHAPYRPSPAARARWAAASSPRLGERPVLVTLPGSHPDAAVIGQVSALYDAAVADADTGFADLLAELERRGRRDDTLVLFLSDHGEELFDHGNVEHGRTLYEEQLRIPMIWRVPGLPGGRRLAAPIDQLDVAPTLLALAGLPAAAGMHGRSFAAALAGGAPPAARSSAAWLDRLSFRQEAVLLHGFKLIRNLQPRARTAVADESLFDLGVAGSDLAAASEGAEALTDRELRVAILRAQLRGWAARSGPPLHAESAEIDERLRRELGALGYLH